MFYINQQVIINKMIEQIKNKEYFISCFDSLKYMNMIIEYLSKFGNNDDWLIYSSEIHYGLIDTSLWKNKFVFFTPTIIYGIDYNHTDVDVFSFIHKTHLNPLQIYQMISRARKQKMVHIYCKLKEYKNKYQCVEDVINETEQYEKNFNYIIPESNKYVDIDDKPLLNYDFNDKKTINLLHSGDNFGITFAESPAMRKVLTLYKPSTVQDIAKCLAIIRPGATTEDNYSLEDQEENNNDDIYIEDKIDSNIIFDDDAIYYIMNLTGCDENKADSIRRLYAKNNKEGINEFEFDLCVKHPELDINDISNKLTNLKKYSFCKSHALSYAYLVWALAYQKANNPKKF
jgi:hypothetical protein